MDLTTISHDGDEGNTRLKASQFLAQKGILSVELSDYRKKERALGVRRSKIWHRALLPLSVLVMMYVLCSCTAYMAHQNYVANGENVKDPSRILAEGRGKVNFGRICPGYQADEEEEGYLENSSESENPKGQGAAYKFRRTQDKNIPGEPYMPKSGVYHGPEENAPHPALSIGQSETDISPFAALFLPKVPVSQLISSFYSLWPNKPEHESKVAKHVWELRTQSNKTDEGSQVDVRRRAPDYSVDNLDDLAATHVELPKYWIKGGRQAGIVGQPESTDPAPIPTSFNLFEPHGRQDITSINQVLRLVRALGFRMNGEELFVGVRRKGIPMLVNNMCSHARTILRYPGPNASLQSITLAFEAAADWMYRNAATVSTLIELVMLHPHQDSAAYELITHTFDKAAQFTMIGRIGVLGSAIMKESVLEVGTQRYLLNGLFRAREIIVFTSYILHRCHKMLLDVKNDYPNIPIPNGFAYDQHCGWQHTKWFTPELKFPHTFRDVLGLPSFFYFKNAIKEEKTNPGIGIGKYYAGFFSRQRKVLSGLHDMPGLVRVLRFAAAGTHEDMLYSQYLTIQQTLSHFLLHQIHLDMTITSGSGHFWDRLNEHAQEGQEMAHQSTVLLQQLRGTISMERGNVVLTPDIRVALARFPLFSAAISPFTDKGRKFSREELIILDGVWDTLSVVLYHLAEGHDTFLSKKFQGRKGRKISISSM